MRSIRARVLGVVLALLVVMLTTLSWRSYRDAQHEIEEVFDAQLAHAARLVAALVGPQAGAQDSQRLQSALDAATGARDASQRELAFAHPYEGKIGIVVFDADGTVALHSSGSPLAHVDALRQLLPLPLTTAAAGAPIGDVAAQGQGRGHGYHDVVVGDWAWRVFVLHDYQDDRWVLVGDRADIRGELAGKIALRSLIPDLIGIPTLALLVWLAVGWGLRPLGRMAQLLRERDAGRLDPLVLDPLPDELEPAVSSLNRLLRQVTDTLERERRFLSYAAHELRTPLAVLHLHAHNARHAADLQDREAALQQLDAGVLRATRLAEQLLLLARLEPETSAGPRTRIGLAAFLRQEMAELGALSLDRGQELTLEVPPGDACPVDADEAGLRALVQNLLTNAVRHTPEGGHIRVALRRDAQGGLELCLQDSGPGVPPALRQRVLEPFFHHGTTPGAGLGLAIVARVVQRHGWTLQLEDSPLGGLQVRVGFAPPGTTGAPG